MVAATPRYKKCLVVDEKAGLGLRLLLLTYLTVSIKKMKSGVKEKFQEVVNINKKGFTILELVFVIVIAGVMAAVALPRLGNVSNVDVYTSARQIKSDIRYTQQMAMSKFKKTTITFDANSDAYHITDSGGTIRDKFLPPSSAAEFNATYSYEFASSGVPTATNGWSVFITSGVQTKQIDVSEDTGRATIP